MARNGSDVLVEALIKWGVDTIFGMPGDGINGVMEAIRTRADRVRFIQVRHEESEPLLPAKRMPKYVENMEKALEAGTPGADQIRAALAREPSRSQLRN